MKKSYHTNPDVVQLSLLDAMQTPMKFCYKCETEKPIDEFPKSKNAPGGYDPRCKECRKFYHQLYRELNRDRLLADSRTRKRDRTARRKRDRERLRSDPDYRAKEYARLQAWHQAHPYAAREASQRKQAKLYGVEIEVVDYDAVLERDKAVCHICGQKIDVNLPPRHHASLQFDHVVPPIRRGPHVFSNIKCAHQVCNVRKADYLMEELDLYFRRGPNK